MVAEDFDVTAYRTRWLGFKYDCKSVDASEMMGNGVLQPVAWTDGDPVHDEYDHGKFQALIDMTGDRIDDGDLMPEDARMYLIEKLQVWTSAETELLVPQD